MYKVIFQKLLILILSVSCCVYSVKIDEKLVVKNAVRTIDLTSQLVKITYSITVASATNTQIDSVVWSLDNEIGRNISYINIQDASKQELEFAPVQIDGHEDQEYLFYSITFKQRAIEISFVVEEVYANGQHPYPAAITQKESQLIRFFGNHYLYSPYAVNEQSTKINLASRNVENYSKTKKNLLQNGVLTLGPFRKMPPFSIEKLMIHYENNSPFLTVTHLKRRIELSHWGNIAVEESVELLHTGAKLKGPFSQYDYQSTKSYSSNSIRAFKTVLPASATSPYYRDFNGNVSTSNVRVKRNSVELELRPRFPLFGGWKTSYMIGYNVPSYQYLYNKDNIYLLKIRILDHIFDDMKVDEFEASIVLPVGATNIQFKTPYPVRRLPDDVTYKYLDQKGRPVIRFSKKNLVESHIQDLEITYEWSRALMFHEPILLSAVIYALFLVFILYVRLDFAIHATNINKTDETKKKK